MNMALNAVCYAQKLDYGGFCFVNSRNKTSLKQEASVNWFSRRESKQSAQLTYRKNLFRRKLVTLRATKLSPDTKPFAQLPLEKSLWLSQDIKEYESESESKELVGQLHSLLQTVTDMIENGAEDSAWDLINANHEIVLDQLKLGMKGVEQAALIDVLAQLHLRLDDTEGAEALLDQLKEIVMEDSGNQGPLLGKILEHMGNIYMTFEKPKEALPFFERSLQIQEGILGNVSPVLVNLIQNLAQAYTAADDGGKSKELYCRAISILEKSGGADCEKLVFPLTDLSHILIKEWKTEEAEVLLRRSLRIMEKFHGNNDAKVGSAMCVLARALCAQGKVDDAVILYQSGLYIMEKNGTMLLDDPLLEKIRTDLAELLHVLGREEESQQLWERNLFSKEQSVGKDHPSLAVHLHNLSTSYAYSKEFEKCEHLLRRNLKILSDSLAPDAPEITIPMLNLATTLYYLEKYEEAENLAQNVYSIREKTLERESPLIGEACDFLSSIKQQLRKFDEAEPLIFRALQIQEKEFGYHSSEVIPTLEKLIVCLGKLGKEQEKFLFYRRLGKLKAIHET